MVGVGVRVGEGAGVAVGVQLGVAVGVAVGLGTKVRVNPLRLQDKGVAVALLTEQSTI